MNELQLRQAAQVDIRYWLMLHDSCPNCGVSLATMHPLANLVPHWHGTCNEKQIVVGPNWIRQGNVDAPLADREAQRIVKKPKPKPQPREVTGRSMLGIAAFCITLAVLLLIWMFR